MRTNFPGSRVLNFHDQPHHVQRVIMADNSRVDWPAVLAEPSRRFDVVHAVGAWWVVRDFTDNGQCLLTLIIDPDYPEWIAIEFGWDGNGNYVEHVYLIDNTEN